MAEVKKQRATPNAVTAGAFVGGSLTTWLALQAQARFGVPAEVSAPLIGAGFAWLARWAAKLVPSP